MFKRILALILCLLMLFAVACKKQPEAPISDEPVIEEAPKEPEKAVNNLTGLKTLELGDENLRPVAIMINNVAGAGSQNAYSVQTGVGEADIVYETEVEGGITRLLAVYKDVKKVSQIGTVRSARYYYIDLAMGHDAIYVHHGQDSIHAGKHLNESSHFTVSENAGGSRVNNGLAREHTLYAHGDKLIEALKNAGYKTTKETNNDWQNFADEETSVTLANTASKVTVKFSNSYNTSMVYNTEKGKYERYFRNAQCKDYKTGATEDFKNVFVLLTTIRAYPGCTDGKGHRDVLLNSGSGYYFVNGTYTPIHWSKGSASSSFVFTNEDGTPLEVNAGNSYVMIADMAKSQPIIE